MTNHQLPMNKIIVAIDGYSSCGKSTIAKALAKYAGYTYVDTGAMYRAIGLYTLRQGLTNEADIISALPHIQVGFFLVAQQQAMGIAKGIVMDGRDIGTVVFPKAELKLFLTASPEVRAQRRFDELVSKGEKPNFDEVLADVNDRDYRDTHRAESPLRQAEDAIVGDNSNLTPDEQMEVIYGLFEKIKNQKS